MKKLRALLAPAGAFVLTAALFAASTFLPCSDLPLFRCLLGTAFIALLILHALFRRKKPADPSCHRNTTKLE